MLIASFHFSLFLIAITITFLNSFHYIYIATNLCSLFCYYSYHFEWLVMFFYILEALSFVHAIQLSMAYLRDSNDLELGTQVWLDGLDRRDTTRSFTIYDMCFIYDVSSGLCQYGIVFHIVCILMNRCPIHESHSNKSMLPMLISIYSLSYIKD